jgi:1,4-dihydroxy-2-naphthoate octaprenyltransferase
LATGPLILSGVVRDCLPVMALIGLLAWVPAGFAARELLRHADEPRRLGLAIKATIAAALMHGLLLACALFLSR